MQMIFIEPVDHRVASVPPSDHWLNCVECRRFFHLSAVVEDVAGTPRCPFPGCCGSGYDFDLVVWDAFREETDPRWPRSTAELYHGLRAPEMEEFYERQAANRRAALLAGFEASSERARLPRALRYVEPFLRMLDCCAYDIDADLPFAEHLAFEHLIDLPRWAHRADRDDWAGLLEELALFWEYGDTEGLPCAADWRALIERERAEL